MEKVDVEKNGVLKIISETINMIMYNHRLYKYYFKCTTYCYETKKYPKATVKILSRHKKLLCHLKKKKNKLKKRI